MNSKTSFKEVRVETDGPVQKSLPIQGIQEVTLSELLKVCLEDPALGDMFVIRPLRSFLNKYGAKFYNEIVNEDMKEIEEIYEGEVIVDLTYDEFIEKYLDIIDSIQEALDAGKLGGENHGE